MATAISWDIILILQIELSRGAIAKAGKAVINPTILTVHIALAVSSVLLYMGLIFTGRKMLNKDYSFHGAHKIMGKLAIITRTLTYITSYFAVSS